MSKPTPPTYTLTLRPEPDGPDRLGREPVQRLRGLLKLALRRFGLRAISVRHDDPAERGDAP